MKKIVWMVAVVLVSAAITYWRLYSPAGTPTVTVYVSHDEVFSEPILKDFEKETGIRVRAVYDTEETKSAGTRTRLTAEKSKSASRRLLGQRAGPRRGLATER